MTKTASLFLSLAGLLYAAGAGAQLYKSVGADGRVTYSDIPPAGAGQVETKPAARGNPDALPADLAAAAKKHPVTLYTTGKCPPCDDGRRLLQQRGVPFAEKTVNSNEDLVVLEHAGGDRQLPLLTVGGNAQLGFEAGAWQAALTAAGYPEHGKLPKSYQPPPAVAAAGDAPRPEESKAPPPAATADAGARQPAAPAKRAAPAAGASPGFRF